MFGRDREAENMVFDMSLIIKIPLSYVLVTKYWPEYIFKGGFAKKHLQPPPIMVYL